MIKQPNKELKIDIKNCYGIGSLEHTFDFTEDNFCLVYAPNGTMKTSLAKIFNDHKTASQPTNFFKKSANYSIFFNGFDLEPKQIFVINNRPIGVFSFGKGLKNMYEYKIDNICAELIQNQKKVLFDIAETTKINELVLKEKVKNYFGTSENIITYIKESSFENIDKTFILSEVFEDNIQKIFKKQEAIQQIKKKLSSFEKTINDLKFLSKNFSFLELKKISKNIEDNFFKAGNTLKLGDKNISSKVDLDHLIKETEDKFVEQKDKTFADKSTSEDIALVDQILLNTTLTDIVLDYETKIKNYLAYYIKNSKYYDKFEKDFLDNKEKIISVKEEIRRDQNKWSTVISDFNKKFTVPFEVQIENIADVILNEEEPALKFLYKNMPINEQDIQANFSAGEFKAVYILDLLFEIENNKKNERLYILDDIIESFDYHNKMAFLEILYDLKQNQKNKIIFLTHNYDFFKTIKSRLNIKSYNVFNAQNKDGNIIIEKTEHQKNYPLNNWLNKLDNTKNILSLIPYTRNIIELSTYKGHQDNPNYKILTSLLHMKEDTNGITIGDLKNIYRTVFGENITKINHDDHKQKVYEKISMEASKISKFSSPQFDLEDKIIISIKTRLLAEKYLINNIKNKQEINNIQKNQTYSLIEIAEKEFLNINFELLRKINFTTPQFIHINSFMYEPLMDMSINEIIKLYNQIKEEVESENTNK